MKIVLLIDYFYHNIILFSEALLATPLNGGKENYLKFIIIKSSSDSDYLLKLSINNLDIQDTPHL